MLLKIIAHNRGYANFHIAYNINKIKKEKNLC